MRNKTTAYIGLGSNLGSRENNILKALDFLKNHPRIELRGVSNLYETQPVGGPQQKSFLNNVVQLKVHVSPLHLLRILMKIEKEMGRKRKIPGGPRIIDLDILTFGSQVLKGSQLRIPHPQYHLRRFVLIPFCDLSGGLIHPILRKRNQTLLRRLTASGQRVTMWKKWKKYPSYLSKRSVKKKSR